MQEGFEKMGLSGNVPNPNSVAADDSSHDTVAMLAPLEP